jgi:restriction system protein
VAIPDYQTLMLPFLRLLGDGAEHRASQAVDTLSDEFGLTQEERQEHLASGPQTRMRNKVGWVCTYLKKAGLIESPARGVFRITERGHSVLASNPDRVDVKYLERFPEFVAFRELRNVRNETKSALQDTELETTPEEALDAAYQQLRVDLELEVLDQVKAASPSFFERLVVELLVRMGYGGSLHDAGRAVGTSGDGGIDGIIKEDRLGAAAQHGTSSR